jgi:hypothetical protein
MTEYFKYSLDNSFSWSEVNLKGEKKYYVEGYASNIFKDKADEIVDFSAQQDIHIQCNNENITMDIEHDSWYSEDGKILQRPKNEKIPVAKIVHSELRPDGVWVKAQLNTNLRSFNELWGSIKDGFLKAFSVAFYPTEKVGNVIKHLKLVNITLTGSPVGEGVGFTASMKSASAWMDSQVKAEIKTNITELKSEEIQMETKEEIIIQPEVKAEAPVAEVKVEAVPEVKAEAPVTEPAIDVKAMKEKYDTEIATLKAQLANAIQSHSTEIATLKAELAKPVMKAVVEQTMPESKPVMQIVSPLGLIN